MSWDNIIGLEREKSILQRAIISNRIAQSYLFYGNEGVGKKAMALEFAKTINCQNPIINGNKIYACDKCTSCIEMNNLTHPNLHLIYSIPAGKSSDSKSDNPYSKLDEKQITEIQEELKIFSEDKYHKFMILGSHNIKIDQIRDVKRKISLSSGAAGKSFIIIFNAEEMTREAANGFLKTLEEPTENTHIILIVQQREMLLNTILSRTQQIYFEDLTIDEIKNGLVERYQIDEQKAKLIAVLSNGSFTSANNYVKNQFTDLRSELVDILRKALKKGAYKFELLNKIDRIIKENDSKQIISALLLFELWLRDAYSYIKTNSEDKIINLDQLEPIRKFASYYLTFDYFKAIELIENSIISIKKNVNIQLILVNLYLNLRRLVYKFC